MLQYIVNNVIMIISVFSCSISVLSFISLPLQIGVLEKITKEKEEKLWHWIVTFSIFTE